TPQAPAAIWRPAIAAHLCALACGRRPLPACFACAAMRARFASNASRSTSNAGVGISFLVNKDPLEPVLLFFESAGPYSVPLRACLDAATHGGQSDLVRGARASGARQDTGLADAGRAGLPHSPAHRGSLQPGDARWPHDL